MAKRLVQIGLLIILLDAVVTALPSAWGIARGDEYLPVEERGVISNFFSFLGFFSIFYLMSVAPIHLVAMGLYYAVSSNLKQKLIILVMTGAFIALGFYLLYALKYSVEWSFEYFPIRIAWYTFLGGLYGLLYFKYVVPKVIPK